MLKSDNTRYESENQRKILFVDKFFFISGLFGLIMYVVYNGNDMTAFIILLSFTAMGLAGIVYNLHRKKEIDRLISGGKYLAGHIDSIGTPLIFHVRGFKCGLFSYIDEAGKKYSVQSEPFHPFHIPFSIIKENAVKIYADSLTAPKITYVPAEYIMETVNDTDNRNSAL